MATTDDSTCPICGNVHSDSISVLDDLCNAIAEIEKAAGNMKVVPAAFERELQIVDEEIQYLSENTETDKRRKQEISG